MQICLLNVILIQETDFANPVHKFSEADCDRMGLRYYSSEIHSAACVLPRYARRMLRSAMEDADNQ